MLFITLPENAVAFFRMASSSPVGPPCHGGSSKARNLGPKTKISQSPMASFDSGSCRNDNRGLVVADKGVLKGAQELHDADLIPTEISRIGSAPGEAWRLFQGESPCRVRPNRPPVSSVADMEEEVNNDRTRYLKRTQRILWAAGEAALP